MSKVSFNNYGKLARELQDATLVAGRYAIQAAAERNILPDVLQKLQVRAEDRLLDIGCNLGNLLIPLSFLARKITGIDHPSCLEGLRNRFRGENIELVEGNFLDLTIEDRFDKILSYSVLHCLSDAEEVLRFVAKAVALLAPGGRVLFGDLPNRSKKERFLGSESGRGFERQWQELVKSGTGISVPEVELTLDPNLVQFNDDLMTQICRHCRTSGLDAYILPQPADLPFGNTREDILVIRPA